jgi:hypothetical protein
LFSSRPCHVATCAGINSYQEQPVADVFDLKITCTLVTAETKHNGMLKIDRMPQLFKVDGIFLVDQTLHLGWLISCPTNIAAHTKSE